MPIMRHVNFPITSAATAGLRRIRAHAAAMDPVGVAAQEAVVLAEVVDLHQVRLSSARPQSTESS